MYFFILTFNFNSIFGDKVGITSYKVKLGPKDRVTLKGTLTSVACVTGPIVNKILRIKANCNKNDLN